MKFKEITTKSREELKKLLDELSANLHELSVKIRMGQEKKTHTLGQMKKDIARILTFLNKKP